MALTGKVIVTLEWSMLSFSLSLVCLRLYLRQRLLNRFTYSDLFVILAWVSFLMQTSMDTMLWRLGYFENKISSSATKFGPEVGLASREDTVAALKIVYVETCLYYTCFYMVKWSMLAFYETLIPRNMKALRLAMWVTVGLTIIGWVSSLFVKMFVCQPMYSNWTPGTAYCDPMTGTIGNAVRWSQHVFTDILVYILPLFLLRRLTLRPKQKIGVAATFVIGFTCIAFACIEQIAIETKCRGVVIWLYSDFEQTWAMVVVCCPAFRTLIKGWDRDGSGASRISRSIGGMFSRGPRSQKGSQMLSGGGHRLSAYGGPHDPIKTNKSISNGSGSDKVPRRTDDIDLDDDEEKVHFAHGHDSTASVDVIDDEKRRQLRLSDRITVTYEIRSNATSNPDEEDNKIEPKITTIAWSACN